MGPDGMIQIIWRIKSMSTLRKIETALLPEQLRRDLKLVDKKEIYLKVEVFDVPIINRILKKMETHAGLTEEEMMLATDAGLIDWEQRYFSTPEWQEREKEADEDIKKGRVGQTLSTVEELQQYLDSLKKPEQ